MRRFLRSLFSAAAAGAVSVLSCTSVYAGEAYDVYNYDRWGEAVPSQAGYSAERSVSGTDLGTSEFDSPCDIFLSDEGVFYIADTGNNRIVTADSELDSVLSIYDSFIYEGETLTLNEPKGVFVNDGCMYIADTGNSRIIRSSLSGEADLVITRPESELYPQSLTFLPEKVIADSTGSVYTIVKNITSGSVMYDSDGSFSGFFGASRVEKTGKVVWDHFWKRFSGSETRRYMTNSVPAGISGFDIDSEGFVYTCSESLTQDTDAVKKVNAAGYNLFADLPAKFGDSPTADYKNWPDNSYTDIDVSSEGFINCLDQTNGRIFQYDEDCGLLFITGASGNQLGTFRQASAVESSSDHLFVLDSHKNTITVFSETPFGAAVHRAVGLYNEGYYEEALEPWYDVLRMDGSYRRAYEGIAGALVRRGEYREAMKYARLADSRRIYSRAFEGWRTEFITENFTELVVLALSVIVFVTCVVLLFRQRRSRKD